MRERWNLFGIRAAATAVFFLLHCQIHGCLSLNLEGLALLEFRMGVEIDPHGAFDTWDPRDEDPCNWLGVHCVDGKVEALYLMELSLEGILAPELGNLNHLIALVLHGNNFTGVIPKEIGGLNMLELLDLSSNNLSGAIPIEIREMISLKCLLLCENNFEDDTPSWIEKLDKASGLKCDSYISCETASDIGCSNRKVGHWYKSIGDSSHDHEEKHDNFAEPYIGQSVHAGNTVRRQLLQETSNLAAVPVSGSPPREVAAVPSVGTGSFPAIPGSSDRNGGNKEALPPAPTNSPDSSSSGQTTTNSNNSVADKKLGIWVYVLIAVGASILLILAAILLCVCRGGRGVAIGPWKSGLSGQLQKAFVTGVPKLNRAELEAACEDFSNIICTFPSCTLYKGNLSSGVEISVVSTSIKSAMDWSERLELCFRKKIDTLSRINHKNFVNLVGYCEENEPFMRMMVFEYSPNGTLSDHLHVKEYEHLDWSARMRIIMGIAYCLQYMHHELIPHVALSELLSTAIYVTDDFAAKMVDFSAFKDVLSQKAISEGDDKDLPKLQDPDPENNVYKFGMLMLEIISGKFPYSEDEGSIVDWGAKYMEDESTFSSMVDLTLKSTEDTQLQVVCRTIRSCLCDDPKQRPTMKEVTSALKDGLGISPEQATPRLSPLWWAELEILSVEAS